MNDTDVTRMFAAAVANPAPDRIDTEAVLRDGLRRRRMRVAGATASVLVVVVLVTGLVASSRPSTTPPDAAAGSVLSVACSASGITVSGRSVAATSRGVVVSVSSTMPRGAYLNYLWDGGGGGSELPAAPTTWTLQAPPGPVHLSCTLHGHPEPGARATVEVTDPLGVWRPTTLADLGCGMGGMLDWGGRPGTGATAHAAIDDLLARFEPSRTLAATPAPIGYPDAPVQTWVAANGDGTPYVAIAVARSGPQFSAAPDAFCGR